VVIKKIALLIGGATCLSAHYQDIIINNEVISKGSRECVSRYEALKPFLNHYKRPFTVLDVGASQGYFSFRIAHDYPAICTMIEGNYQNNEQEGTADSLEALCQKNSDLNNIMLLKKNITSQELKILSECEHFDVVLALNIVHHFGEQWKQVINALLAMGDHIIIQVPPADDTAAAGSQYLPAINNYLETHPHTILGHFERQTTPGVFDTMFLFSPHKTQLQRVHWHNSLPANQLDRYEIKSSFEEKFFYKKKLDQWRPWHPGINLLTFKILNGCFPSHQHIAEQLVQFKNLDHNDLKIWNLIIQGHTLVPIDGDDPEWEKPWINKLDHWQKLMHLFENKP
jgi:hypothetical protein